MRQEYERVGIYKLEEVLPFVVYDKNSVEKYMKEKDFDGHMVKMGSQRYKLFALKGTKCARCGIVGSFFALEKQLNNKSNNTERYHFNLYAKHPDGSETMITKDHIVPKSKGGKNTLSNLQPMCIRCNAAKGATLEK